MCSSDLAHDSQIIHSDIKPDNILCSEDFSVIKLADFGIARDTEATGLTATGRTVGTFAYMAPEQFEGKEADARTDIYAFGLILYEMATGKRAVQGTPPALDQLPERLAYVLQRCLAEDPDTRWQSAAEVRALVGALVTALLDLEGGPETGLLWICAAPLSRMAGLLPMMLLDTAKPDGKAAQVGKASPHSFFLGLILALVIAVGLPLGIEKEIGPLMIATSLALLAPWPLLHLAKKLIGGQTGDVAGAAQQLAEIAFLVILSASGPAA